MTHPEDLLTDYVDGTLSPSDRRDVEGHLTSCDRCRLEVALAGEARIALSTLGVAPAPAGLADRAVAESLRSAGRASASAWYR